MLWSPGLNAASERIPDHAIDSPWNSTAAHQ